MANVNVNVNGTKIMKAKGIIEMKYLETFKELKEVIVIELSKKYKFEVAEALLYLEEEGEKAVMKGRPKKEKKKTIGEKINEEVGEGEGVGEGEDIMMIAIKEAQEEASSGSEILSGSEKRK
jgi:hypothetical protein